MPEEQSSFSTRSGIARMYPSLLPSEQQELMVMLSADPTSIVEESVESKCIFGVTTFQKFQYSKFWKYPSTWALEQVHAEPFMIRGRERPSTMRLLLPPLLLFLARTTDGRTVSTIASQKTVVHNLRKTGNFSHWVFVPFCSGHRFLATFFSFRN